MNIIPENAVKVERLRYLADNIMGSIVFDSNMPAHFLNSRIWDIANKLSTLLIWFSEEGWESKAGSGHYDIVCSELYALANYGTVDTDFKLFYETLNTVLTQHVDAFMYGVPKNARS
jgi:hypothetical protein